MSRPCFDVSLPNRVIDSLTSGKHTRAQHREDAQFDVTNWTRPNDSVCALRVQMPQADLVEVRGPARSLSACYLVLVHANSHICACSSKCAHTQTRRAHPQQRPRHAALVLEAPGTYLHSVSEFNTHTRALAMLVGGSLTRRICACAYVSGWADAKRDFNQTLRAARMLTPSHTSHQLKHPHSDRECRSGCVCVLRVWQRKRNHQRNIVCVLK